MRDGTRMRAALTNLNSFNRGKRRLGYKCRSWHYDDEVWENSRLQMKSWSRFRIILRLEKRTEWTSDCWVYEWLKSEECQCMRRRKSTWRKQTRNDQNILNFLFKKKKNSWLPMKSWSRFQIILRLPKRQNGRVIAEFTNGLSQGNANAWGEGNQLGGNKQGMIKIFW